MTDPAHPLARLKEAALAWVRATPSAIFDNVWHLSMRVNLSGLVDNVSLRPEDAPEDLRYEIAEWSTAESNSGQAVEILGRASSIDGAKALLEAEHTKAPGKVLLLRERARVITRRGPDETP